MGDFGSRLKKTRKSRKVTQKDLAKDIKVAQSTIANYENNIRFPGSDILRDISDYLDVSIDYLLGLSDFEDLEPIIEDFDYDLESFHINLIELLLDGKIEQAKHTIKDLSKKGINSIEMIERVFLPALKLIGDKWEKGQVDISEEHYITEIIEKMFAYVSESQTIKFEKNLTALFMVPTGEEHIIGLKMATEYFKLSGWKIRFIGRNIPINSLIQIIDKDKVDLLVLSATIQSSINSISYLVSALRMALGKNIPKILIGGNSVISLNKDLIDSFSDYSIKSFSELNLIIEKIEKQI